MQSSEWCSILPQTIDQIRGKQAPTGIGRQIESWTIVRRTWWVQRLVHLNDGVPVANAAVIVGQIGTCVHVVFPFAVWNDLSAHSAPSAWARHKTLPRQASTGCCKLTDGHFFDMYGCSLRVVVTLPQQNEDPGNSLHAHQTNCMPWSHWKAFLGPLHHCPWNRAV